MSNNRAKPLSVQILLLFIGGILGFTQVQSGVQKPYLTAHLKAAVHSNFQGLCEVVHSNGKNFTEKAISEDEENKEPSLQQMKTAILLLSISP